MLAALHAHLGIERAVIVQASCHGTDNAAMLDCIASDPRRYRGVAIVNDSFTDTDLDKLDAGGVRGVRFNFVKHLGGAPDIAVFNRVIDRIKGRGWHVVLHVDAPDIIPLSDMMRKLPLPFIVDHMGRVPSAAGVDQPPLRALIELSPCRSLMRWSRLRPIGCCGARIFRTRTRHTRPTRAIWSIWCRNSRPMRWRRNACW
jgi:predicted TIM-barrel fold metal-dependent hydrolase